MCFQPLGEPKNAEKRSLSVDEMQKTRKSARRRSTKRKKREKPRFVGVQSIKNGKNSLS